MVEQDDIKELEASIQRSKELVELGNSLERLTKNQDFRTIVREGYFNKEAIRLVHLRGDPAMQTPESQASILKQMDAVAGLNQYFTVIRQQADMARRAIAVDSQELEDILAGENT